MLSDAQIVEKVIEGDRHEFAELVRRYERAVRAVALRILGNNHSAEDCSQDVFVKAYINLGTLRDFSVFGPWIMKITRREAISYKRKQKPHITLERGLDVPALHRDRELDESSRVLLSAVMKLSESDRQIVMLRHFEGLAVRAIAELTGRAVGTITKQLSRAHARLRKQLEGMEL